MDNELEDLLSLFRLAGRLKTVDRRGWFLKGVNDPESVADHSYRTAFISLYLARLSGANESRAVEIALIHDIGESLMGDLTPHDDFTPEQKREMEQKAVKRVFQDIDNADHYLALWHELEECSTLEGRLVRDADKLDMALQAYEYKRQDPSFDHEEFIASSERLIQEPISKEFLRRMAEFNPLSADRTT